MLTLNHLQKMTVCWVLKIRQTISYSVKSCHTNTGKVQKNINVNIIATVRVLITY